MAFVRVNPGDPIQAHQLDQVIDALNGVAGAGQPIQLTQLTDATNFAETVQNLEATNSRALLVLKSDGTQLVRVDVNGVTLGSPLNLPTGSVTSTNILDGTIQNVDLGPDVARANLLTNGGFEIWQRGNGPFTNTGSVAYNGNHYSADRWNMAAIGTDSLSVSRDTTNQDTGSVACAAVTFTLGSGGGASAFCQPIIAAEASNLAGRPISFSIRVRTSTANAIRVFVNDGAAQTTGSIHTGSGTYQTLTVSATPATGQAQFVVGILLLASCTAYIDNACLVVGSQPANYVPLHPADDLARCLRYYEVLGSDSVGSMTVSGIASAAGQNIRASFRYVRKPVTPTVTRVGTWSVTNSSIQPTGLNPGVDGLIVYLQSSAAGDTYCVNSGAGQYITVESNP